MLINNDLYSHKIEIYKLNEELNNSKKESPVNPFQE